MAYKIIVLGLIFLSFRLSAQITTTTVNVTAEAVSGDAMVGSAGLSNSNFSGLDFMNVMRDDQTTPIIYRSFVSFKLSQIPTNAIITNATLKLVPKTITNPVSYSYDVERATSAWTENSITWANQSTTFSSDMISVDPTTSVSTLPHQIDVKSHVQNMVNYPYNNHGWRIHLNKENEVGNDYGVTFYTANHVNPQFRPTLEVSYVLPMEVTSVITHCTPGNDDGTVDFTISKGSANYNHCALYKIDIDDTQVAKTTLTLISSGTTVNNTSIDATNLSPGLYMFRLRDALWTANNTYNNNNFYEYYHFLVGREGETTVCLMTENLYVKSVSIAENIGALAAANDFANMNYKAITPTKLSISSTGTNSIGANTVNAYNYKSLLDFNIDIKDDITIDQADLHLYGWTKYYQTHQSSNEATYTAVTSAWQDHVVTWNSKPSLDNTFQVTSPKTATANGYTTERKDTINLIPLFNYWKTNANYGLEMALSSYSHTQYASRDHKAMEKNIGYLKLSFTVPVDPDTPPNPINDVLFTPSKDASVANEGLAGNNYGSIDSLSAFHIDNNPTNVYRANLAFDLNSIPQEAIIVNATLKLTPKAVNASHGFEYNVERITNTWIENTLTWNNQVGSFASDQITVDATIAQSNAVHEIDVKGHVQNMVSYPYNNHGWNIRLNDEGIGGSDYGVSFYSNDHSNATNRPQLMVTYILPMAVSSVVTHCTPSNTDGAVDLSISGGSGGYNHCALYRVDKDNTQAAGTILTAISSGTDVNNSTIDASNLEPGLYLFRLRDSLWTANNVYNNDNFYAYYHFLVGREGETTSCLMTEDLYVESVSISENIGALAASNDFANTNYNTLNRLNISSTGTNSIGANTVNAYNQKSLLNFNIDFKNDVEVTQADLHFYGYTRYYQTHNSSNEATYTAVTSPWHDHVVTWNSQPSTNPMYQVISAKTEVNNGYSNDRRDTIGIIPLIEYWQGGNENYGLELALSSYAHTHYAARTQKRLAKNVSYLEFSFKVKPPVSSTYDEATGLGEILVNVPDGLGPLPYTYLIGTQSIGTLSEMWGAIPDSIKGNLNSEDFTNGKVDSKQFVFEGLKPNKYYVAVFDNLGQKILEENKYITNELLLLETTDLVIENTKTLTLANNRNYASGELESFIMNEEDGAIEIAVTQLEDFTFGFGNISNTAKVEGIQNYEFCVDCKADGNCSTYLKGVLQETFIVQELDVLLISKEIRDFVAYKNRTEISRLLMASDLDADFSVDFELRRGSISARPAKIEVEMVGPRRILLPIRFNDQQLLDCETNSGQFRWTSRYLLSTSDYSPKYNPQLTIYNLSVSLVAADGTIYSANSVSGQFTNLPLGVYTVNVTWSDANGLQSGQSVFIIGHDIDWNIVNNMSIVGSSTTIAPINNTINGNAFSSNTLNESDDGWVSFELDHARSNYSGVSSFFTFGQVFLQSTTGQKPLSVYVLNFGPGLLSKTIHAYDETGTSVMTPFFFYDQGPLVMKKENGDTKLFYRNQQLANYTNNVTGDYNLYLTSNNIKLSRGLASFCPATNPDNLCAHLDYELNGNYYVSNSGKFCFVYNEEYNDPDIKFNIYNIDNEIVLNQNSFNLSPMIYGENRVVLDFTNFYCFVKGYYMLEVTNSKNEKFYLRFYNDKNPVSGSGSEPCPLEAISDDEGTTE